ncbi:MAG: DNA polymerase III subunit beta, partial [Oscillospiraceae bacterium]|nr:DNA polymerase III subunit beta [Oscillospiraceae bacterium]
SCDTGLLNAACNNVQRAVSAKSTLPTIEGILFKTAENGVELCGYDLDMGIKTTIPAKVERGGSVIINAKMLCDIIKHMSFQNTVINVDERNICIIKNGDSEYSIIGIDAEEYPELPFIQDGAPVAVPQGLLKNMIRQTVFAVSADDSNTVHKGVKFIVTENNLNLLALDGYRLASRNGEIEYSGENLSFIVPGKTLNEISKFLSDTDNPVVMGLGKRHIVFYIDDYIIISRLFEGEFIDYKASIPPERNTKIRINTKIFIESIEKTAAIITEKIKSPICCSLEGDSIKNYCMTPQGTATDRIKANIEGVNMEIGFNNRYLIDALRACETDEINIEMKGPLSPVLILPPDGDSFFYMVLPVRLSYEKNIG